MCGYVVKLLMTQCPHDRSMSEIPVQHQGTLWLKNAQHTIHVVSQTVTCIYTVRIHIVCQRDSSGIRGHDRRTKITNIILGRQCLVDAANQMQIV